jgi:hypothetical protein
VRVHLVGRPATTRSVPFRAADGASGFVIYDTLAHTVNGFEVQERAHYVADRTDNLRPLLRLDHAGHGQRTVSVTVWDWGGDPQAYHYERLTLELTLADPTRPAISGRYGVHTSREPDVAPVTFTT